MWHLPALAVLAFLALPGAATAQTIDPHAVFETRCSGCHKGHAGAFARTSLFLSPDGVVTGKKKKMPVRDFLAAHFGKLSQEEAAVLTDMFARQIRTGGLYERKCRTCHDSASHLARTRLYLQDKKLVGRFTARDINEFLTGHGRLEPSEIEIMRTMLDWQLRKAGD